MNLQIIATGSSGNCYILEGKNSALIIECGVSPKRVMQQTTLRWSKIKGALISHEHGDHAKYARHFQDFGVNVFASEGTLRDINIAPTKRNILQPMTSRQIDEFLVMSFGVHHDAAEPLGFLIEHPEMGRLLFVTDTSHIDYNFQSFSLDHIMCEANYCDNILLNRIETGLVSTQRAERVSNTHMSLYQAERLVSANINLNLKNVVLIHLSEGNSDSAAFENAIQQTARFAKCFVAREGMKINISKNIFEDE